MIPIHVDNQCADSNSYRANRVKSMFNATSEQATRFTLDAALDITEDGDWQIGVVVGPSGSGKTSIGKQLFGGGHIYEPTGWAHDKPIVDCISPNGDFDTVTNALSQAGLGDVPAWLRPYDVLSNGQKFRADLAKVLAERPNKVIIDEFSSVVDRQIARVGAGAFAKGWRRGPGKAVLLSCHYDVLDWLEPDWVFDTATGEFRGREGVQHFKRPRIDVEIRMGGWNLWPLFKPHHYLDSGPMAAAKCYVGFVEGEPVVHLGVATKNVAAKVNGRVIQAIEARACRMVTLPEWQGAGVGTKFLNTVCQLQLDGEGVLPGRRMTTIFHTSHPSLCGYLRHSTKWRQVSYVTSGGNKRKSIQSLRKAALAGGRTVVGTGYGGHLRAVQGFRYYGDNYTRTTP